MKYIGVENFQFCSRQFTITDAYSVRALEANWHKYMMKANGESIIIELRWKIGRQKAATYFARETQKLNFCLLILAPSADIIHTCLPIMKLNWCIAGIAQKWLIVLQRASKPNCKSVRVEKSDSSNILVFTMITNCDDMIMIDLAHIIIKKRQSICAYPTKVSELISCTAVFWCFVFRRICIMYVFISWSPRLYGWFEKARGTTVSESECWREDCLLKMKRKPSAANSN